MKEQTFPEFSVLMSVYAKDDAAWLGEALDSVLNQSRPPSEIVVVADGPVAEPVYNLLENYRQKNKTLKVFYHKQNEGLGLALRKGLEYCTREYVARMDSDDISDPRRFERQLAAFNKTPAVSVIGGQIEEFDAVTLKSAVGRRVPEDFEDIKKFLKSRTPLNHVTVMFKKADVLAAGSYRNFPLFEDYDLWVRMCAAGFKMRSLPYTLVKVRTGGDMYARRGGRGYFKYNKNMQDELLARGIITWPRYVFNIAARFGVQVLMPNKIRTLFYNLILRRKNKNV